MERSSDMSREMVLVVQGIIILLVSATRLMPMIQKRISSRGTEGGETTQAEGDKVTVEGGA